MKNHLTFLFFLVAHILFCQNDIPDFEFAHELDHEYYYEFIDDNVPFINLTQDKFFQKRKENKIRRITVKHIGLSLDSLYAKDTSSFHYMVRNNHFDHGYSYMETFDFDDNGFTISKSKFPIASHLNKKDSIKLNQLRTSSSKVADSLIVAQYFKNPVLEKTVYLNHIVYQTYKEEILKPVYDSITKVHSSKSLGYIIVPITYFYSIDNKISRIKCDARQRNYYDMTFHFPDQNQVIINCSIRSSPFDSIKNLENKILKNNRGQIMTSMFYYTGKPDDFSRFTFTYDKHHNLSRIKRQTKAKDWFDYTEKLYRFRHTYRNGKLNKTIVHYNFRVAHNDFVYLYNDRKLISELDIGDYKIYYDYIQN